MGDFQSFSTYSADFSATELINRPDKTYAVKGQAEFLAVAVALDVPILSAQNNVIASMNILSAGAGASFAVFASAEELSLDADEDFINATPGVRDWIQKAKDSQKFRRYVTKKIVTSQGVASDSPQLAAAINEIRVLSNETIRQCDFIVSMLAISWSESPSVGRFWPQVLLEAADEGTLTEYLSSNKVDFKSQLAISMNIGRALQFLHAHGIVHADLKPTNVLVFTSGLDEHQHDLLDKTGLPPIRAKLCDFGYAVILDDYKSENLFQARIGSLPWMAPELDAEEPIRLEDLHRTDIYSLGLLTASIFMNGYTPFESLSPGEVLEIKTRPPEQSGSAVATLVMNIKEKTTLTEQQEEFVYAFLDGTCAPSPSDRVSLSAIQSYLFLGLMQQLHTGKATIPLEWFKDLRPAADGYKGALAALEKKHSGLINEIDQDEMLIQLRQMYDEVISIKINNPEFEEMLATCFEDHSLKSASLKKFKKNWKPDGDTQDSEGFISRMEEIFDGAIAKVPDFAFEHTLNVSLIPRVAQEEAFRDLRESVESGDLQDSAAPLHLAGAYLNGQLVEPSTNKGLEHLVRAAMMENSEALSVILNIFDACDTSLPSESETELLRKIESYGTKTFGLAQGTLFDHLVPKHLSTNQVLGKTWTRKWPEKYEEYLATERRFPNMFLLHCNSPLFLKEKPNMDTPVFDFDRLACLKDAGKENIDPERTGEFKEEVTRLDCLNCCNKDGFMLLQIATVKNDLVMAHALVELGADVNAHGNTHGWVPLLLSCHCGHFDMAKLLIDNGADPTIRESLHGATILHSLTQFSKREHCEEIFDIALSAGLDINVPMKNGATPLHTTFAAWDYSRGVATELLLEYGADATRQVQGWDGFLNFDTAITHAAQQLDVDLLRRMLAASEALVAILGLSAQRQLSDAKAQALSALFQRTRFYCMCVGGKGYKGKLETVIFLLADEDARSVLIERRRVDKKQPTDPFLTMCTFRGYGFFVDAFLKVFPDTVIDDPSWNLPRLFLHVAIERRDIEAVRAFVRQGAGILTKERGGRNALHFAAHYFPKILPELIKTLEEFPSQRRQGKSMTGILEEQCNSGLTVFAQLLVEGYDDERKLAETLRAKYSLNHDYKMHRDGSWVTFGGYLVSLAVADGLVPVEHIQYLLKLDPLPEYATTPTGKTLLATAIEGFSGSRDSYELACHQITRMLLAKYPDFDDVFRVADERGRTSLHIAAYWSNTTALQMIKDHAQRHFPNKNIPWNTVASGNTVLDHALLGIKEKSLPALDTEVNKVATRSTRKAALACYVFLRENGALHNWELDGSLVAARLIMYTPDFQKIGLFLRLATQRLGLGPPDVDLDRCVEVGTTTSLDGRLIRVPVVDLIWKYDNFILRFYSVRISSLAVEGLRQFYGWLEKRLTETEPRCYESLGLPAGLWPFMTLTYDQPIPYAKDTMRWTRSGRIWAEEERDSLKAQFSSLWDIFFGEVEEQFLSRFEMA
ncbi:serine/threonine protein kinase [Fusarium oxysporum f. sp. lycopersici 4287]|uniref:Serine/threonine protein kinase n=3 Tax=Fusarium oxysporum TaxID=5507 RepID=A0A0J9UQJ7_FUSO4|nr:serine/threonine protein kinase [Fusarium oxysporum f. sp. lycopersici 4287]EXK43667.1 serine/threonine protein kinase [Fusarium oxysporum f. sp. melonis 26406]KAJ9427672.1 serine/threonine protein kinase [Fusarium oxysporum]KNB01233.1 serine/threonine protein kinase [Fusarium oxysporum f. sp. lycopersici 4287]